MRDKLSKQILLIILIAIIFSDFALAQSNQPRELRQAQPRPDEMVSMSKTMSLNQALEILSIYNKLCSKL